MDAIGVYSAWGSRGGGELRHRAHQHPGAGCLKKHSEKIVVNFDPDTAGAKAAESRSRCCSKKACGCGFWSWRAAWIRTSTSSKTVLKFIARSSKQAPGYFHWLADRARKRFDMSSSEGRIAGLQVPAAAIQRVTDKLERATIAEEVAVLSGGASRGWCSSNSARTAASEGNAPVRRRRRACLPPKSLLLNALLVSVEAREKVLPKLVEMQVFQKLAARPILEATVGP